MLPRSNNVICTLLLATALSVVLIYFINAEVEARRGHDNKSQKPTTAAATLPPTTSRQGEGILSVVSTKLRTGISTFFDNFRTGIERMRSKRETVEEHRLRHNNKSHNSLCYSTQDVLFVVGVTCGLNFGFVLAIWACFSRFGKKRKKKRRRRFKNKRKTSTSSSSSSSSEDIDNQLVNRSWSMEELRFYYK